MTPPNGAGDVDVFRDALTKAAKTLEANLRVASRAMRDLRGNGVLTTQQLGDWDASRQLGGTVETAHREIVAGYQQFLTQYQAVIDALHQTAAAYDGAEQESDARLRAVRPDGQVE